MFRRILLAAVMAGLVAGLAISMVQEFTTTPIILHAEQFETAGATGSAGATGATGATGAPDQTNAPDTPAAEQAWAPRDGIERTAYTALANIVIAVGFGLMLIACFALKGGEIDGRRGVLWGLAGYAVFSLAPALSLPPAAPGSMAAELAVRQQWWLMAAGATALGLWLMIFGKGVHWIVLGIVVLAAPHVIGAPQPERIGANIPPEIAGQFAAASLVTSAIFWAVLGWASGTFYRRAATDT
jgi:cobalt transporter subunit CbtA